MLVRPDDDGVYAQLPSCRRRFGEACLESRCCHHWWCYCCCELIVSTGSLFFVSSSFIFSAVCILDD
jgi:hypothetical protein